MTPRFFERRAMYPLRFSAALPDEATALRRHLCRVVVQRMDMRQLVDTVGARNASRALVRPVGVVNGDRWKRAVCAIAGPLLLPVTSLAAVVTQDPVFGLTFDDGPDVATTPAVLESLARHDARATFFMLADRAEAQPELARSVARAGHEVALHGDDHTKLASLPARAAQARIARARQRLEDVVETRVRFFRFPCGDQRLTDVLRARRLGLDVAVWTTSAGDYKPLDVTGTVQRVAKATFPGAMLLLHDGYESGVRPDPLRDQRGELVDQLLVTLATDGLWPASLGELCAGRRMIRVPWLSGRVPELWRAQHRRVSLLRRGRVEEATA